MSSQKPYLGHIVESLPAIFKSLRPSDDDMDDDMVRTDTPILPPPPKEGHFLLCVERGSIKGTVKPSIPPEGIASWVQKQEILRIAEEEKRKNYMASK